MSTNHKLVLICTKIVVEHLEITERHIFNRFPCRNIASAIFVVVVLYWLFRPYVTINLVVKICDEFILHDAPVREPARFCGVFVRDFIYNGRADAYLDA